MAGLRKKRRIQLIVVGMALLLASAGLVGFALKDGIEFFRSPSQIMTDPLAKGEVFRLGGLVEEGSIERGQGQVIRFRVTDGSQVVSVEYAGILPDLFSENQGMIGTGQMQGDVFVASEILAKHDEEYMPREVMDALKEQGVYQEGEY